MSAFHKVSEGYTHIYDVSLGIGGVWGIGEGVYFFIQKLFKNTQLVLNVTVFFL
jgi:hypothetical protein